MPDVFSPGHAPNSCACAYVGGLKDTADHIDGPGIVDEWSYRWIRHQAGFCAPMTRAATAHELHIEPAAGGEGARSILTAADLERAERLLDYELRRGALSFMDYQVLHASAVAIS